MSIEPLESRIAPAAVFKYTDIDGDIVSIAVSKATTPEEIAAVCTFSDPNPADPRILLRINFSANAALFAGTNLAITAKRGPGIADGLANVGYIDATDTDGGTALDLGSIRIAGDLGRIEAGTDSSTVAAVKSLTVRSMGRLGTRTQLGGGDLVTTIAGTLGKLTVKGDLIEPLFQASSIGDVTIGGSLVGGDEDRSGSIITYVGSIGAVKIRGNVEGASGSGSGSIFSKTSLASVTIGGSLVGGTGDSGKISATGSMGAVKVGGDVLGLSGVGAGSIRGGEGIASVKIGGSLIGGRGSNSGNILSNSLTAPVGPVTIGGDVIGGMAQDSGKISGASLGRVKIGGSVIGGGGTFAGAVFSFGATASVTIGGSLIGGTETLSGSISGGTTGPVKIGHDILGGFAAQTGKIDVTSVGNISVGGSLIGGRASSSGLIRVSLLGGSMGAVKIAHDVQGGYATGTSSLENSGAIVSNGRIASVFIGGSLLSSVVESTATAELCGAIYADDDIGSVTIKGSVIGLGGTGTGSSIVTIAARGQSVPGAKGDVAIGRVSITGRVENAQILAGYSERFFNPGVNPDAQIGAVRVGGDWIASSLVAGAVNLGADDAIGGTGADADNVIYGNSHDAKIALFDDPSLISRIASVKIGGLIAGSAEPTLDRFGFVAEEIGAFQVGGHKVPLKPNEHNDGFVLVGSLNDVRIHEILTP
jgi:hypothetical protein